MNGEYIFFGLLTTVFNALFMVSNAIMHHDNRYVAFFVMYATAILGVSVFLMCRIGSLTSLKKLNEEKRESVQRWLHYAVENGVMSQDESEARLKRLLPHTK